MVNKLKEEWYRLNNIDTSEMDSLDKRFHAGLKTGILKAINIINASAGADIHAGDGGYRESTHEEQAEFAKKRYHISNTQDPIDFPD
jgi:hypothetical protein